MHEGLAAQPDGSLFYLGQSGKAREDDPMSLQDRIEALKAKHHALEAALEAENSRPRPDDGEIARLKKQKLQIKDEIATLSQQH
jgi:hypothetical protein